MSVVNPVYKVAKTATFTVAQYHKGTIVTPLAADDPFREERKHIYRYCQGKGDFFSVNDHKFFLGEDEYEVE